MQPGNVKKTVLYFFLMAVSINILFAQDTQVNKQDDEFELFLLLFGLALVSFVIGFAIIGVAVALGIAAITVGFITMGILSSSVFVGLSKRSVGAAFKTFLYLSLSAAGAIAGAACFFIVCNIFHLSISNRASITTGIIGGIAGGILLSYLISLIMRRISKMVLTS